MISAQRTDFTRASEERRSKLEEDETRIEELRRKFQELERQVQQSRDER
jgi:F0F1-type ATP synthase membrane subunit b/b'